MAAMIPATMNAEAACDVGAGVMAYLNQHWIPGSPRRPAVAHVLAGSAGTGKP